MARVNDVEHDGTSHTIDIRPGKSVMKGAVRNKIPGIDGNCGGGCVCGTCHVYVDEAWLDRLTPRSLSEESLLGYVKDTRPNGRLSCQIAVSDRLEGLVVHIPETQ